jgi:hypothetical protein
MCLALGLSSPVLAQVQCLGVATVPGNATDKSGLTDKLSDGTPHNRLGSMGSAIAYTGNGNRYILVSDRGPADGTTEYFCRFHVFDIEVNPGRSPSVLAKLLETHFLTDEAGRNFVGSSRAFDVADPSRTLRLDPEGVRVGPGGNLYVSDEYGPFIYEFDGQGRRVRSLKVPSRFLVAKPGASAADELPPNNQSGRLTNRGMEGLAISPDRTKLYGLMQSPLIQDGALGSSNKRVGTNNRLLELDLKTGATREFVYCLEKGSNGANEIVAVGDGQFLVLERDNKAGDQAAFKKIFKIDIASATDVTNVASLPQTGLPGTIRPVAKTVFIDLLNPAFQIAGANCPAKFEGLAFGPDLPDGRHLLLVTNDNDFKETIPTYIYAFAIDPSELPNMPKGNR